MIPTWVTSWHEANCIINKDDDDTNKNNNNNNNNIIASRIPAARPEGSPFAARGILSF